MSKTNGKDEGPKTCDYCGESCCLPRMVTRVLKLRPIRAVLSGTAKRLPNGLIRCDRCELDAETHPNVLRRKGGK